MKTLISVLLIVLSCSANAGIVLTLENEVGSTINFTDANCDSSGSIKRVFSTTSNGGVITGCYVYLQDIGSLKVLWFDGSVYTYPVKDMRVTDYGQRNYN